MGNPWAYDFTAIGRRTSPLLVVIGGDADPSETRKGGSSFGGNSDIYQLIPETQPFEQLNLNRRFLKPQGRPDFSANECVLNLVTDPDQHPRTLHTLAKLLRGYRGRVINRPEAVLRTTRDQVAKRLKGVDGLRVPRVLRFSNPKAGAAAAAVEREGLSYPLIVRRAGTHTGMIIGLIENAQGLDAACSGQGAFILTEFVDFRTDDGLYRKYRLWSFGGRTIFKHSIISDQWNVHNKDRSRLMPNRPDLIDEEMRLMERPEGALPPAIHNMFGQVRARLGLDFFGMDFGIDRDGQAILFEANATMSFAMKFDPPFRYLEQVNEPARQALQQLLFPGQSKGEA